MTISKLLSIFGFWGEILTEVMMGGELILGLGSGPFSQERLKKVETRSEKRLIILINEHFLITPLEIMPRCSAAGLHFNTIPAGFNAPMEFLTGFT